MYDFLKISCPRQYHRYWLENDDLDFHAPVSVENEAILDNFDIANIHTGEVLNKTYTAKEKNLEFKIIPSHELPGAFHCKLAGSLHKYHNNGIHNADSFFFDDFRQQVQHLQKHFEVNPTESEINQFEYGVNIPLPDGITAGEFIDSIICMPTKRFSVMNINKVKVGKIAKFTNHDLKIYDKAGQCSDHKDFDKKVKLPSNMVRIEIRVKKMRYLESKTLGLKKPGKALMLSDLLNPAFASTMGDHLAQLFSEVVFFDNRLTLETMAHLTELQQKHLLRFQSYHYWENLDSKQRYRQRKRFAELLEKCDLQPIQAQIATAIIDKTAELLCSPYADNGVCTHQNFLDTKYHKKGMITPFKCRVQTSTSPEKNIDLQTPPPKKVFCSSCGRDISHQRKGSKFCSEKRYGKQGKACRNKSATTKRYSKGKLLIQKEVEVLTELKQMPVPTQRISITLNTGERLRPTVQQLITLPWSTRRKIIILKSKGQTITRSRAKQYVKHLKDSES